ncbi:hypothetical protein [Moritella sp. JT01]|nr:hypothetical protein [Moritella sp. JT01]
MFLLTVVQHPPTKNNADTDADTNPDNYTKQKFNHFITSLNINGPKSY